MMSAESYLIEPPVSEGEGSLGQDPDSLMTVLHQWLGELDTQRRFRLCADAAIQALRSDPSLRVPRSQDECKNGFSEWLRSWRERLGPAIQQQFRSEFPDILRRLHPEYINGLVTQYVWPQIEPMLLSYAIRGLSRSWASKNLGDAVVLSEPELRDDAWVVQLQVQGHPEATGMVVLNSDGEIIVGRSTSRDEILCQLDE